VCYHFPPIVFRAPASSHLTLVGPEGHGWFLRRYDQQEANQFLAFIGALPSLTIHGFDADDLEKMGAIVRKFSGQNLTLADAHGSRS
jgi:hypothetical protein